MIAWFYADWCGHCQSFKPIWNKVKAQMGGGAEMVEVDGDKHPQLIQKYGIQGFPTVMSLKGAGLREREVFSGKRTEVELAKWIKKMK